MAQVKADPGRGRGALVALLDRWLKRRTRLDLPITLGYRQIFILPTRFGWMLGLLMGARRQPSTLADHLHRCRRGRQCCWPIAPCTV